MVCRADAYEERVCPFPGCIIPPAFGLSIFRIYLITCQGSTSRVFLSYLLFLFPVQTFILLCHRYPHGGRGHLPSVMAELYANEIS
jgi:hypothetical protein